MTKSKLVIETLVKTNNPKYQLLKACEELSELNTALMQYVNKGTKKQEIIDEIGDVKIRLKILEKVFSEKKVKKRYNFKINKFYNYIKQNKYIGRI